ncbi:hypothetical protein GCM10010885_19050 [Alicyclobacillus cellulosilyticus]|uniref:DUF72 domain-containing protein n=1 Tax=Alicyclobacillus cellulosilyticus TaxID=1003997 RepID=A0A917KFB8_9BACL|nr:DUF72 domain-containing protein [Alicyclobacillus cellulosilyticus]GGJ10091.1 hypothetical protein GCM10010885_19050 [Alicyclobacillus cellulosilyticus]
MAILCGTCAWTDHTGFYPPGLPARNRLAYYAQIFPLVEIDSSYYHIPAPETVRRWARETPDDFVFNMKAYRSLTFHERREPDAREWQAFLRAVDPLAEAGKLGAVLLQFPPWFTESERARAYVEQAAARLAPYPVAVEFRHRSWWDGEAADRTAGWLQAHGLIHVVCDEPQVGMGSVPFVPVVTNDRLVVFRLHGRNQETWAKKGLSSSQQRFDYLYTKDELAAFVPHVLAWSAQVRDVHILMNNNQGNYAVRNALDWFDLLRLPPRQPRSRAGVQLGLFDGL